MPAESEGVVVLPVTPAVTLKPPSSTPRSPEASEMHAIMAQQTAALMKHMETLMSQQEQVITRLLQGNPGKSEQLGKLISKIGLSADSNFTTQMESVGQEGSTTLQAASSDDQCLMDSINFHRRFTDAKESASRKAFVVQDRIAAFKEKAQNDFALTRRDMESSLLGSWVFESVMTLVVVFNIILIIRETDMNASCTSSEVTCLPPWFAYMNIIFVVIYTVEGLLVIDAYRCEVFGDNARLLEFLILILSYAELAMDSILEETPYANLQSLRLVRLARLVRGWRLFLIFPDLKFIMVGFFHAMRAMLFGFVVLSLILLSVAVISVDVINPINARLTHDGDYCEDAFSSVWRSSLLLFQTIVAGDSWGACILPVILDSPLTWVLLGGSLVAIQVGFLNLVMAVVIDKVAEGRESDKLSKMQEREKEIRSSRARWFKMFETLDADKNGQLSMQELMNGFESMKEFQTDLMLLGIERCDLPILLGLLDEDHNAQVSRDELVSMFEMIWFFDTKMHNVTMSMQIRTLFNHLDGQLRRLQQETVNLLQLTVAMCQRSDVNNEIATIFQGSDIGNAISDI